MISRVRAAARRWAQEGTKVPAVTVDGVKAELRLAEIPLREMVELVRIDVPADELEQLLELGLMPGCQLCPVRRSPFGDPVLMVDGALIAVRREMAGCLCVRRAEPDAN
ncbi:MAG: FeoA family protein [Gemmatimonadota bacterium]